MLQLARQAEFTHKKACIQPYLCGECLLVLLLLASCLSLGCRGDLGLLFRLGWGGYHRPELALKSLKTDTIITGNIQHKSMDMTVALGQMFHY